jgi:hypothetical protein
MPKPSAKAGHPLRDLLAHRSLSQGGHSQRSSPDSIAEIELNERGTGQAIRLE